MSVLKPSFEEIEQLDSQYSHAVISASIIADGDTPLSLFARLRKDEGGAFLFESVEEGGEQASRWSFFGSELQHGFRYNKPTVEILSTGGTEKLECPDPLEFLTERLTQKKLYTAPGLPPFTGGSIGYISFDTLAAFENVPLARGDSPCANAELLDVTAPFAYDHATHRLYALESMPLRGDLRANYTETVARLKKRLEKLSQPVHLTPFSPEEPNLDNISYRTNRTKEDFLQAVLKGKQAIVEGEVFQVLVSLRWTIDAQLDPFSLYRALRAVNPSPYMFLIDFPEGPSIVGASPEVMVRVIDNEVTLRPIAGTRKRGKTYAEDIKMEKELLADAKERAEHMMLLDLGRNDVGRVCKPGTVRVEAPLHIERYAHVMHIVSDIHGELADDKNACDAFKAGFPAGTMVGAPKIRATELIAELEPDRRGLYSGAVGYFDHDGNMDTCIAIRSMIVHPDKIEVQAGAGIVHDSIPEMEYKECQNKARSPMVAIAMALNKQPKKEA